MTFHSSTTGSWIDAGLESPSITEPRLYTAMEQRLFPDADALDRRRRIDVSGDIAGFDDRQRWHDRHLPGATAFARISAAELDEIWHSIAMFLRVGDVIRLQWRADNMSDSLIDPELHRDDLSIAVHRGRRRWLFLLDVQVRPGPARMITRTQT
ncbi:hypothetical protein [Virgisporangium ochraceum]|uniref:hypothetical protein n=1 Tax=Virgisporangium ochraceum TaxID=65505 RepID=UPI0019447258|nr:hypothetical protein [Virgisporangium ochraceum]